MGERVQSFKVLKCSGLSLLYSAMNEQKEVGTFFLILFSCFLYLASILPSRRVRGTERKKEREKELCLGLLGLSRLTAHSPAHPETPLQTRVLVCCGGKRGQRAK